MDSLVLGGEPITISIVSLLAKCRLFQTKSELLDESYRAESSDSLRVFVGAISDRAGIERFQCLCGRKAVLYPISDIILTRNWRSVEFQPAFHTNGTERGIAPL
jgi:hypothetical protein